MKLPRTQAAVAILAVLVIFGILTLAFWNFVRDTIVIPIYYLFWEGGLIINSISQNAYLIILSGIILLIALGSLRNIQWEGSEALPDAQLKRVPTRLQFWARVCGNLQSSGFARDNLASEARKLILAILSYQEGIDPMQLEQMILASQYRVPDPVMFLFVHHRFNETSASEKSIRGIVQNLRYWLLRQPRPVDPSLEDQVEGILNFIENRLEISHDEYNPK